MPLADGIGGSLLLKSRRWSLRRARLDCLGVFLVARDDERLFAAGKSGRAEHVLNPLPFTAQPCTPLPVGTRARAWVKKRLGTPPPPPAPAPQPFGSRTESQALVVVLVLGQHVPSCCLLLSNYLQVQNVWGPPGSNTSGFDEFVRSIHSNAAKGRAAGVVSCSGFVSARSRARGPGGSARRRRWSARRRRRSARSTALRGRIRAQNGLRHRAARPAWKGPRRP